MHVYSQILTIKQITQKWWDRRTVMYYIFIHYQQAHDFIDTFKIVYIMYEFGILTNLV